MWPETETQRLLWPSGRRRSRSSCDSHRALCTGDLTFVWEFLKQRSEANHFRVDRVLEFCLEEQPSRATSHATLRLPSRRICNVPLNLRCCKNARECGAATKAVGRMPGAPTIEPWRRFVIFFFAPSSRGLKFRDGIQRRRVRRLRHAVTDTLVLPGAESIVKYARVH